MRRTVAEHDFVKYSRVVVFAALATGLALRWWKLGFQSLWFDEGYTAWISSLPAAQIPQVLRNDVGAPLYYLLMHVWGWIAGDSEWGMRSFSAACSSVALLVFVDLARRVLQRPWAVAMAVGLFALSAMQVQHAQEARYYGLISLLSVVALECIAISTTNRRPLALIGLVLSLTAALYTHNVMLLYWAGLNGAWVFWPGRPAKERIVEILLVNLAVALLYAPWISSLMDQLHWAHNRFWQSSPTLLDGWHALAVLLGIKPYFLAGIVGNVPFGDADNLSRLAILLLLGGLIIGLWCRHLRGVWLSLVLAGLLPVAAGFVQSHLRQPIFMDRIFIASCAPLALLMALPMAQGRLPRHFATPSALLVVLAGLSSILFLSRHEKENWREAYDILSHGQAAPRLIVFVANEGQLPFDYYQKQSGTVLSADETGLPDGFFDIDPPQTVRRVLDEGDLSRLMKAMDQGQYRQIDLVRSHDWFADPENRAIGALHLRWRWIGGEILRDIRIDRYVPAESAGSSGIIADPSLQPPAAAPPR
ncbi:MAG: glycosyltransferase family 39 protein [Phycisphaerales bacterium]|nr:glycosyltransferase family 39 protein [Phycisphaerales bacterium]